MIGTPRSPVDHVTCEGVVILSVQRQEAAPFPYHDSRTPHRSEKAKVRIPQAWEVGRVRWVARVALQMIRTYERESFSASPVLQHLDIHRLAIHVRHVYKSIRDIEVDRIVPRSNKIYAVRTLWGRIQEIQLFIKDALLSP